MKIQRRSEFKLSKSLSNKLKEVDPATIGHWVRFGSLDSRIKSMVIGMKIVGTAFTVKTAAYDSTMVHKAISLAEEGDVLVVDRSGDEKHACIGEIVAYAAKVKNIAGIVVDGPITDIQGIKKLGIPIFATGTSPVTTRVIGESGEINTNVHCGGVSISPGDVIIGDDNGVIVLENDIDIEEMVTNAKKIEESEPYKKKQLDEGVALSSISKADELLKERGLI